MGKFAGKQILNGSYRANFFSNERIKIEKVIAQIAQIVPATDAEGPGNRFAIWFQGCPLRCKGCCNPEMLSFDGGTEIAIKDICEQITSAIQVGQRSDNPREYLEGITLLGGEPFSHAEAASQIAAFAQRSGLTVMIFSGFLIEDLNVQAETQPDIANLLTNTDMLVDGPYDRDQPDRQRRFIGSTNQRVHFLTRRYSAEDEFWNEPDTLEVRLADGQLTVNGFPAKAATGIWKRPKKNR